jgi:hypothetical protein
MPSIARHSCRYSLWILLGLLWLHASCLYPALARAAPETAETAETALSEAEVAVAAARARDALWTTAFDALLRARTARRNGDYAGAVHWSRHARELATLGMEQRHRARDER